MKISYFAKLCFLLCALILVIYSMGKLRGGVSNGVAMVLGLPEPGEVTSMLDWCDTRVKTLSRPGKPMLTQLKLKWMWKSKPQLELNPVAVEKWFGRFCRVKIERLAPSAIKLTTTAMVVDFIKGPPEVLEVSVTDPNIFKWRQEIFKSTELAQALEELDRLPDAGARTSN